METDASYEINHSASSSLKANKRDKIRRPQQQEKWNRFEPCLKEFVLQGKVPCGKQYLFNPCLEICRKTTFRHRATSSAWNRAKTAALKMGHSPTTAKRMGREAASEVSRKIDAGLLSEIPTDVD